MEWPVGFSAFQAPSEHTRHLFFFPGESDTLKLSVGGLAFPVPLSGLVHRALPQVARYDSTQWKSPCSINSRFLALPGRERWEPSEDRPRLLQTCATRQAQVRETVKLSSRRLRIDRSSFQVFFLFQQDRNDLVNGFKAIITVPI